MRETAGIGIGQRLAAEALGTALLVAVVIGSGIMAERLAAGNAAVALLGNTLATGAALMVLISIFGPVSGAHFNPAVTLYLTLRRQAAAGLLLPYLAVQIAGGLSGAMLAHGMFDLPLVQISSHVRTGIGQWAGEFVATFALLATIVGSRRAPAATPYLVGLIIMAGYWFTSSTSFANPAVTIARSISDTFAGIRPVDAPGFIAAQLAAVAASTALLDWLFALPGMPAHKTPTSKEGFAPVKGADV
jgi:glycerol uptake facilitator-like aquaporin